MDEITDEIMEQIAQIRKNGETNMFDRNQVQILANNSYFYALVIWIEFNKGCYGKLLKELGNFRRRELGSTE